MERTLNDVTDVLRLAKENKRGCSLLIGAGCSVTAGIPTAQQFVTDIRRKSRTAYERAEKKTYPHCMAELDIGFRRDLIAKYVDHAKINWAHIAIAQLIKHGFVDRILTTNFDSLLMQSCALVGEFPAVYDFAASQMFKPADVLDKAIFHLHGQRTGFRLLHTSAECDEHSRTLSPVFQDAGAGRVWLVVGYSGENDPVFDHLANVPRFDFGLYWIGYLEEEPGSHVQKRLLSDKQGAYYIKGFDADSFFIELARSLNCFPPDFVGQPFTHLDRLLDRVTDYGDSMKGGGPDIVEEARKRIASAIARYEKGTTREEALELEMNETPLSMQAQLLLAAGDYQGVIDTYRDVDLQKNPFLDDAIAWAWIGLANELSAQARGKAGEEADRLYAQAGEKYAAALEIKPDMHEALYNWGITLVSQGWSKTGEEAERLYTLAGEKYAAALEIKPDMHEALYNWGITLGAQARGKTGVAADRLYLLAGGKYTAALEIKPDKHEALYSWGNDLGDQARSKTGEEADRLYALAGEKYKAALELRPDKHEALYSWGSILGDQARVKAGEEADRLYALAGEKYAAALEIKPDKHEALFNWGSDLGAQARSKTGEEADRLYALAGEKYAAALELKPDRHEPLFNWGSSLSDQARSKTGEEADGLYALAGEKYAAALELKPDKHEALNNWGSVLVAQARIKAGEEAERLYELAGEKYAEALELKPEYHEALSNLGSVLVAQARIKAGEVADRLYELAGEKYAAALELKPEYHEALNNWGGALVAQARSKAGEEADRLYALAGEKYAAVLEIRPDKHEALNNWGSALISQCKTSSEVQSNKLLDQAKEILLQTEEMQMGEGAYNLACVSALQDDPEACRHWLETARDAGSIPNRDHLEKDEDLDSFRGFPWFKAFLDSLGAEGS